MYQRPGVQQGKPQAAQAGSYSAAGGGGAHYQAHGGTRGGQLRPGVPWSGAQRISSSVYKATPASSYAQQYPMFEGGYSRFGGSLDGTTGGGGSSAGGSVDGDSSSTAGYSWQNEPPAASSSAADGAVGGAQLQAYTTVKEIGGGGAGKAYLVTGKTDGKQYVAKQIVCLGDQYKAAPASYALQETRLLFLLQHPHICALVDFFPKSANFFIVMEYCEQGDLSKHISHAIRRGNVGFDADRIYTWWYQILDAIDFCHSKGVLHRDLKPKNIFIDASLNVKVGDFGVSALLSSPPAVERIGTANYHAPEVTSSLHYSVKSDVWAIGVIMWEAMQLRPPGAEPVTLGIINFPSIVRFYGQAANDLLVMHLTDHPEQRAQAGKIKEAMLQLLQDSTRQKVASRASLYQAMAQSDAARKADRMRPQTVQVIITQKDRAGWKPTDREQEVRDESSNHFQGNGASDAGTHSSTLSSSERSNAPTTDENADAPEVLELSAELGIYVTAGAGGEFGAWKIASLPADKPAAKSNGLAVGEYLWEINGKIIFGMPFQLISSLIKGTNPVVRLGVKAGLGLSIREALIHRDGTVPKAEALVASSPQEQPVANALFTSPTIPYAESRQKSHEDSKSSSPALPAAKSPPQVSARVSPVKSPSLQNDGTDMADDTDLAPKVEKIERVVPAASQRSAPAPVLLSDATSAATPPAQERSPLVGVQGSAARAPVANPDATASASPPAQEIARNNQPGQVLAPEDIRGVSIFHSPFHTPGQPSPGHIPSEFAQETNGDATVAGLPPTNSSADKIVPAKVTIQGVATIAGDGHYRGELLDGKPFGMGVASWPQQGHTYEGEWRNGVMHGQGTATYLNGDRYDGEWANGKRSGLGRYAHGSGDIYEGLWDNERKHGLGVDSFADGRGYRGEFSENKFAGAGSYFTVDGAVYQGDWLHGKAHGSGISTSTKGGQPAFVEYIHGNLTKSEAFEGSGHEEKQSRVENLSRAATAIALLARRVASLIQAKKLETPMPQKEDMQGQVMRVRPTDSGNSPLGKALVLLAGVHSVAQEDSSLVITTLEESEEVVPMVPGDIIYQVAARSCSWYKGMTLEDILAHLQSQQLAVGLKSEGMLPWEKPSPVYVTIRQPGFVV